MKQQATFLAFVMVSSLQAQTNYYDGAPVDFGKWNTLWDSTLYPAYDPLVQPGGLIENYNSAVWRWNQTGVPTLKSVTTVYYPQEEPALLRDLSMTRQMKVMEDTLGTHNTRINAKVNQAGARSAISLTTTGTSGAATYNSSTGVLNVPQYGGTAPGTNNASAYASGTVYALTTTSAKVDFGTTDPVITIPAAGTYLIMANVRVTTSGLTQLAANQCDFKLRRTNNTAADITNATATTSVPVATLLTSDIGDADIATVIYTTTNSNDVIEIWGSRALGISLGAINVSSAHIVAVRLY